MIFTVLGCPWISIAIYAFLLVLLFVYRSSDKLDTNKRKGYGADGQPHLVPLSNQSITFLQDIHEVTGNGRYIFPSELTHTRPMSENTVLFALRRMGFAKEEITGHGFRAIARTILDEVLNIRPDYIEHQLAHAVRDPNGRAYNRTAHLEERQKIMQLWANYLDELKFVKFT